MPTEALQLPVIQGDHVGEVILFAPKPLNPKPENGTDSDSPWVFVKTPDGIIQRSLAAIGYDYVYAGGSGRRELVYIQNYVSKHATFMRGELKTQPVEVK
jgi:hypothetical protein